VTVIKWTIAHSVWQFVYQRQQHNVTISYHKVKVDHMWWLNLVIQLATVSIIHMQNIVNIKMTI